MPKKSISDEEIAIIKSMLNRGMKNKDIQFFFNRPDRAVNSGRITGIRKGTYANSKSISAASASTTDDFIKSQSSAAGVVVTGKPSATGPLSAETLAGLFEEIGIGLQWRLKSGETDQHECKANFGFKHSSKWLKAIAALANNRGGYVLFGVHDKGTTAADDTDLGNIVCGLSGKEFAKADPADFTKRVKATFDPTPRISTTAITVGGKSVGVIHVERHPSGPVIATRSEDDIKEGDVYFRYPGQSARIKYSDLRAILDERDSVARAQILPMVERLLALGPDRVMLADLKAGSLVDGKQTIQIDASLLEKIAFIKEGHFEETADGPALRLVGEVTAVNGGASTMHKGVITRSDLENDFLSQTVTLDPKEYIRFALEHLQGGWVPLRYYAKQATLTKTALFKFINATNAPASRKSLFIGRLSKDAARQKASGKAAMLLKAMEADEAIPEPQSSKEAGEIARAIQMLTGVPKLSLGTLLKTLKICTKVAQGAHASSVRRALCRVDEIFFTL